MKKFRELLKDPQSRERIKRKLGLQRVSEGRWEVARGVYDYSLLFEKIIGESLLDFLTTLAKRKKRLSILDDGAGLGRFLSGIKAELKKRQVDVDTSAVVLEKKQFFSEDIDNTHIGPAQFFLPDKKYDVIFSYYGSIHYTDELGHDTIKHMLPKYANVLNHGGVLLIGGNFIGIRTELFEQMKIAFQKQGFQITFMSNNLSSIRDRGEPSDILMIRRL